MGDRAKWLRFNIYPTRTGAMVVALDREWGAGRPTSRRHPEFHVAIEGGLSLDDPRAALLALSDALASAADTFPS